MTCGRCMPAKNFAGLRKWSLGAPIRHEMSVRVRPPQFRFMDCAAWKDMRWAREFLAMHGPGPDVHFHRRAEEEAGSQYRIWPQSTRLYGRVPGLLEPQGQAMRGQKEPLPDGSVVENESTRREGVVICDVVLVAKIKQ